MTEEYIKKAQELINENQFLMISMTWCPDCHYAHKIWQKYGVQDKVKVIEFDLLDDQEYAKELRTAFATILGQQWVPTIFFNHKRFGTEADLKELEKLGKTEQTFKDAGLIL